jgi:DNA-binding LacI/PurR family transcriptional regulator
LSQKRVTSKDVARLAGVSRTTVSFVLNNVASAQISPETRQKVLQAAIELGYVPDAAAQSLASGRSKIIGLVLNRSPHHFVTDAYITQVLNVLVVEARKHDMRLLLEIVEDSHPKETYLNLAISKRIDGIIFSGPRFDDLALQTLFEYGFPTVVMGKLPGTLFPYIDIDNRAAAYQAVAHLLKLGHTRIACITNAALSYTAAVERLQGYRDALQDYHVPYDPALVRHGDFDPESGFVQMSSLLQQRPLPTAVFAASDVVAMGVIAAIKEHRLAIPGDIALVGFDDVPLARYLDPPLTTIRLPTARMAQMASDMVIDLIHRKEPKEKYVLLDTELVIRKSCGAAQRG